MRLLDEEAKPRAEQVYVNSKCSSNDGGRKGECGESLKS